MRGRRGRWRRRRGELGLVLAVVLLAVALGVAVAGGGVDAVGGLTVEPG